MTALISQMTMPADAGSAGLRAGEAGISGDAAGRAGDFAGLMALVHARSLPGAPGHGDQGDAIMPPGGEILPADLPFADGEYALLPVAGFDGLAVQVREALAGAGDRAAIVAGDSGRASAMGSGLPHPAASALMQEDVLRFDALRRGEGAVALPVDLALSRGDPAGLAVPLATQAAPVLNINAVLQRAGEGSGFQLSPEALQGLMRSAESGGSEQQLLYTSAPVSGLQTSGLSQGIDRALPGWTLGTPLHQTQQWGDEVGQRIRWMVGNQVHAAELRINPPQLGQIEVRVSMQNEQMSITFLSQNALVRDTLEDAIPRLRDMLNQQGFTSVDVNVSQHQASDGQGRDGDESGMGTGNDTERHNGAPGADPRSAWRSTSTGFIDTYA